MWARGSSVEKVLDRTGNSRVYLGYHPSRVHTWGSEDVKKYLLMLAAGAIWLLAILAKSGRATKQADRLSVAHQSTIAKAGNESLKKAEKAAERAVEKVNQARYVKARAEEELRSLKDRQETLQERLDRLSGRG